jgi:four helix bundle protein
MTPMNNKSNPIPQASNSEALASVPLPPTSGLMPQAPYVFPFEKLDVYQMAVDLADYVLGLLERIPLNKHLRLVSQMEGAVVSVSQNIAEGKGRQYKKEFIQFLSISQGSLYETITLNEVFRRRKLFSEEDFLEVRTRGEEIDRKLNGLMNSLRGSRRGAE